MLGIFNVVKNGLSKFKNADYLISKFLEKRNFSSVVGLSKFNNDNQMNSMSIPLFKTNLNLIPVNVCLTPSCGLKVRGIPKLRCKYCYYAGIEGVLHVFCDKYPRHKQRAITNWKKKKGYILTHACMSKFRPY